MQVHTPARKTELPKTEARETGARRTGGRSARVLDAIYTAVGQLMAEGKPDRITIPMVAERAGVNPTSIYRRWSDIDELLEQVAVAVLTREGDQLPDTGSIDGDLGTWARIVATDIARPERTRYLKALASARDDIIECQCWAARREQAAVMLDRARERGEATPTKDQVVDHIIAPLYHHAVFGQRVDQEYADRLVGDVLAMAPARS